MTAPRLLATSGEPNATRLLTPAEVADRLRVSRSQVYALVRSGSLVAYRLGKLPRIAEVDLEAWLVARRGGEK